MLLIVGGGACDADPKRDKDVSIDLTTMALEAFTNLSILSLFLSVEGVFFFKVAEIRC